MKQELPWSMRTARSGFIGRQPFSTRRASSDSSVLEAQYRQRLRVVMRRAVSAQCRRVVPSGHETVERASAAPRPTKPISE